MANNRHTELSCSPDGPWLILRAAGIERSLNVRHIVAKLSAEAGPGSARKFYQAWTRDRLNEGPEEPVKEPESRKPIPASRRIPGRTVKR